jgi:GNAT superfamily N-acetyltransferase
MGRFQNETSVEKFQWQELDGNWHFGHWQEQLSPFMLLPMPSLSVRRAEQQDVGALIELCVAHAEFEGGLTCGTDLAARLGRALFGDSSRAIAWVAEQETDREVVGYASASPVFSTWQGQEFLHLDCLFLIEDARGHDGGRMLFEAARSYAAQHGFPWMEWQTPVWNAAAMRFYQRLGAAALAKQRFSLPSERASPREGLERP